MTSEVPEKGDKVSWSWGGGAPAGTVAETKDEGEIAIKSKRGNTIKRNASPGNPAVHVERSGNDVVKRASELTVDEKASGNKNKDGDGSSKRKAESQEDSKSEANGEGNEATEASDLANQHVTNKQGKKVKKGGKDANKKRKTRQDGDVKGKTDGSKASEEDEEDEEIAEDHEEGNEEEETEEKKDQDAGPRRDDSEKKYAKTKRIEVDLSKNKIKSPGKSKTGEEKDSAAQKDEDQVSTRTRSHDKAA